MGNLNHKEIFFNRAEVQDAKGICCDNCFERVVFLLQDKEHEFSLGLSTVLECLMFAVKNGDLPKLPRSWAAKVDKIGDTNFHFDEDICYFDYNELKRRE